MDGVAGLRRVHQAKAGLLQCSQTQEEESHTKEEVTDDTAAFHINQDDT